MQDRILEIVVYLMNQISEHQETIHNIDEMSADLRSMGFTDNEISSAYNWLLQHFEDYPESFSFTDEEIGSTSVRILSETERKILSPEAYGYLLQLRHLRLLTTEQLEMILDRCALFASDPVDVTEVKILASSTMFDTGSIDTPFMIWVGEPENEPIN
ncbi:MAG: DUF494 family protein [Candidatus Zixiibacteriota bacterium]